VSRPTTSTLALAAMAAFMLVFITLGGSTSAADTKKRPATWMTVRGLTDRATLTSICGQDQDGGAFCAETDKGFVGRLPVRGRDVVKVRTRPPAGRVKAYLVRLRPNGDIAEWLAWSRRATEIDGSHGRRWRFRLPSRLSDANAIHLFLHYPGGASFPGGDNISQATYTSLIVHD
jgi:hypothetical protein